MAPEVGERISQELQRRILDPYLQRQDFWWMGFQSQGHHLANWVPWTTGNCLINLLLEEEDETNRRQAISKGLASLDIYLKKYSSDGGCDEGPSYWGRSAGSLFEILEMLLSVTGG